MPHHKITATEIDFREEFDALRTQVNDLLQSLKSKSEKTADTLVENIESKAEHYQDQAEQKLHDVYEAGNAGLHDVSEHVRKNPVASMLIAFGVGYALFKVLGQGK
ncbi:DUF883 family protein [Thiothrix litoralis]|uniref:DUF883 family protein n=1 Tax=Thiothrix litoralis TaxID=2891210 RepID=A0ABX7WMH0_9GAMM|nr:MULTISPECIES: DUF883 family protein [Thiothrix]QTR44470.1 DUF883 family protein [Thiothrix litoralis]WMP18298.1 DUF883 family protein [Thiothrix lacustris]